MANINSAKDLDEVFAYHPSFGTQTDRYVELRAVAKTLAASILMHCPPSRERSLALTHVQEAVMWACAAISVNEQQPVIPAEHSEAKGREAVVRIAALPADPWFRADGRTMKPITPAEHIEAQLPSEPGG